MNNTKTLAEINAEIEHLNNEKEQILNSNLTDEQKEKEIEKIDLFLQEAEVIKKLQECKKEIEHLNNELINLENADFLEEQKDKEKEKINNYILKEQEKEQECLKSLKLLNDKKAERKNIFEVKEETNSTDLAKTTSILLQIDNMEKDISLDYNNIKNYIPVINAIKKEIEHLNNEKEQVLNSNLTDEQKDKEIIVIDKYLIQEQEQLDKLNLIIKKYNEIIAIIDEIEKSKKEYNHLNNELVNLENTDFVKEQKEKEREKINSYIANEDAKIKNYLENVQSKKDEINKIDISNINFEKFIKNNIEEKQDNIISSNDIEKELPSVVNNETKEKPLEEKNDIIENSSINPQENVIETQDNIGENNDIEPDINENANLNDNDENIPYASYREVSNDINEDDEDLVEVVDVTPWQWVKDHKKQILIALGLSALAVSLVVLVTQLLPALIAAQKASYASGVLSQMLTNSHLWASSTLAEQTALHGANTALANNLTAITGMANSFNTTQGVWTIGGEVLGQAAKTATAAALKAKQTASLLQGITLTTGIGGLASLGLGSLNLDLSSIKHSEEYERINNKIKSLKEYTKLYRENNYTPQIQAIYNEIENSNLSTKEKKILLKKLNKLSLKEKAKNEEQFFVFEEGLERGM